MAKIIKVGKVETIVDDDDYIKFKDRKWYAYESSHNSFIYPREGKTRKYLHREIMEVTDPKIQIDHINRNTLDNRKENLRICACGAQNAINRPKQKNNTSGYKGVFLRKDKWYDKPGSKKYRAMIRVNQKLVRLGQFETAEEAALAYNEAAIKYFKEFAYLNVVKEIKK